MEKEMEKENHNHSQKRNERLGECEGLSFRKNSPTDNLKNDG